jgi:hypothetical protein
MTKKDNMPRLKIDYIRTQIYKIDSNDLKLNELYKGSNTDFRKRKKITQTILL